MNRWTFIVHEYNVRLQADNFPSFSMKVKYQKMKKLKWNKLPIIDLDLTNKLPIIDLNQTNKLPVIDNDQTNELPVIVNDQSNKSPIIDYNQTNKLSIIDQEKKIPSIDTCKCQTKLEYLSFKRVNCRGNAVLLEVFGLFSLIIHSIMNMLHVSLNQLICYICCI